MAKDNPLRDNVSDFMNVSRYEVVKEEKTWEYSTLIMYTNDIKSQTACILAKASIPIYQQ
jgi:hypothetical protein